jgi:hypothetical protein
MTTDTITERPNRSAATNVDGGIVYEKYRDVLVIPDHWPGGVSYNTIFAIEQEMKELKHLVTDEVERGVYRHKIDLCETLLNSDGYRFLIKLRRRKQALLKTQAAEPE